ncbi:MAG: hypothetical protein CK532_00440 [Flavobacteriales bacterium]|nr:MAG: hypothetical protein CK532_00440 [Flavobacteriales bacterium]
MGMIFRTEAICQDRRFSEQVFCFNTFGKLQSTLLLLFLQSGLSGAIFFEGANFFSEMPPKYVAAFYRD